MESKYTKLIEQLRWQAVHRRTDPETANAAADAIDTLSRSINVYAKENEALIAWRRNAEAWMQKVAEEKAAAYHREAAELIKPAPAATTRRATRESILHDAERCVCGQREQDYGTPENNFAIIANLWTAYSGYGFEPVDVAMMMALLKIARISNGGSEDSFVDLAGYAACGGEIWANREEC